MIAGEADALGGDDIRELQKAGVPVISTPRWTGLFNIHHSADDLLDKIDPKRWSQCAQPSPILPLCIGRESQEPRTNSKTARPARVHPDELGKDVAFSRRKKCRAKEGFLIGCRNLYSRT
jgi:GTP cyclohydrolase II